MTRECSGCGRLTCEGQCYLECPSDFPEDEETTSTLTLEDCRRIWGNPFGTEVHSDPLKKRRAA